jgi:hypothetical protein
MRPGTEVIRGVELVRGALTGCFRGAPQPRGGAWTPHTSARSLPTHAFWADRRATERSLLSPSERQYSTVRGRCLTMVDSRGALHRTSRRVIVKPVVMLAARCLGPGRLRLDLVKLAHDLGEGDNYFKTFYGGRRPEPRPASESQAEQQPRRAA